MNLDIRKHLFKFTNPETFIPSDNKEAKTMEILTIEEFKKFAPKVSNEASIIIVRAINTSGVVTTKLQVAHLLAQCAHESNYFTTTIENLNYSADALLKTFGKYFTTATVSQYARKPEMIANRVYANRMGNGAESSGDGFKYRGRGYIQLTGKNNYREFFNHKYGDYNLLTDPSSLSLPEDAIDASLWYWKVNNVNKYSNKDDILAVSRLINLGNAEHKGTPHGMEDRQGKLIKIKSILGI